MKTKQGFCHVSFRKGTYCSHKGRGGIAVCPHYMGEGYRCMFYEEKEVEIGEAISNEIQSHYLKERVNSMSVDELLESIFGERYREWKRKQGR